MRTTSRLLAAVATTIALTTGGASLTTPAASASTEAATTAAPTTTRSAADGKAAAEAFKKKWNGVAIDVDGAYGAQCWDLAARFSLDIGLPAVATGDGAAAGIYENFATNGNAAHYKRLVNSETDPSSIPRPGDIIVWNRNMGGGYGHVALVLSGTWNTVTVLEQNPGATHVTTYPNYANVLGWLRPNAFV